MLSKQAVKAAPSPSISHGGRAREHSRACHRRVASVIRPHHQSLGTLGPAVPSLSLGHPSKPVTGNKTSRCIAEMDRTRAPSDVLTRIPTCGPGGWGGKTKLKSSKGSVHLLIWAHQQLLVPPWQRHAAGTSTQHCLSAIQVARSEASSHS